MLDADRTLRDRPPERRSVAFSTLSAPRLGSRVEFDTEEQNRTVGRQLADDCDDRHQPAGGNDLPVVVAAGDDGGQFLEPKRKLVLDRGELEPEKVDA